MMNDKYLVTMQAFKILMVHKVDTVVGQGDVKGTVAVGAGVSNFLYLHINSLELFCGDLNCGVAVLSKPNCTSNMCVALLMEALV